MTIVDRLLRQVAIFIAIVLFIPMAIFWTAGVVFGCCRGTTDEGLR